MTDTDSEVLIREWLLAQRQRATCRSRLDSWDQRSLTSQVVAGEDLDVKAREPLHAVERVLWRLADDAPAKLWAVLEELVPAAWEQGNVREAGFLVWRALLAEPAAGLATLERIVPGQRPWQDALQVVATCGGVSGQPPDARACPKDIWRQVQALARDHRLQES